MKSGLRAITTLSSTRGAFCFTISAVFTWRCAMKIGFSLPNIGPIATPEAVSKVAQRAEALGYDSLWTVERLLYPVKLQTPYPGTPDGSLPELYKHVLDPLEALTFAAAQTTKIALGTSV